MLQGEVIKGQLVGAIRLDIIRLLGFTMNREPVPGVDTALLPDDSGVRAVMAHELRDLGAHLRDQAEKLLVRADELQAKEDSAKG